MIQAGQSPDTVMMLLGTIGSLAAVLLLAWFVLRWMGRRLPMQGASTHKIEILDRTVISPDKCFVLVRVAEKTILVGMSGNAVQNLCDIEDPEGTLTRPEQEPQNKFSTMLGDYMSRGVFRNKKEESD